MTSAWPANMPGLDIADEVIGAALRVDAPLGSAHSLLRRQPRAGPLAASRGRRHACIRPMIANRTRWCGRTNGGVEQVAGRGSTDGRQGRRSTPAAARRGSARHHRGTGSPALKSLRGHPPRPPRPESTRGLRRAAARFPPSRCARRCPGFDVSQETRDAGTTAARSGRGDQPGADRSAGDARRRCSVDDARGAPSPPIARGGDAAMCQGARKVTTLPSLP